MQVSEDVLQNIANALKQGSSIERDKRVQAEQFLRGLQSQPGFSTILLKIAEHPGVEQSVRQQGAIHFKNFVKEQWANKDESQINANDRTQIKAVIVQLMLSPSVPSVVERQLAAALEIICKTDFPAVWPELLPELVKRIDPNDPQGLRKVLHIIQIIMKKYQYASKDDKVIEELLYILKILQHPLTELFKISSQSVAANPNAPNLKLLFQIIKHSLVIYYSLCSVDLPEYFEDHLAEWMTELRNLLNFQTTNTDLVEHPDDDEKPGLLHKAQASICKILNLFIEKYEEEFKPYLPTFVRDAWALLVKIGTEPKYDTLVTKLIDFLTAVSKSIHYEYFKEHETLKLICEGIVIPNMKLRETEEDLFSDNAVEYIRRDIEGSDADTRRRSASELVKGLRKNFQLEVTQIFSAYINAMLQEYAKNPAGSWQAKDVAIYLVTALAVTTSTASHGATSTNELVNVLDFFASQILPELQAPNTHPILKADGLKFALSFRALLPKPAFATLCPVFTNLLTAKEYVIASYAAMCVDRFLTVQDKTPQATTTPRYTKDDIKPFLQPLLLNLFKHLESTQSIENEYIMRAIMRVIITAKEEIVPFYTTILGKLLQVLAHISKNPTNPLFNHYVFEAIAALISNVVPVDPSSIPNFEAGLFPAFQNVLTLDIAEFSPYVFQILSQLLENSKSAGQTYLALLGSLVAPLLWERTANIPALVRLLQAYLRKAAKEIIAHNMALPILGVFQKLIASRAHDHEGFYVLESIVENFTPAELEPYMSSIFTLLFTRLQNSKTEKFVRSFVVFLSLFVGKHGPDVVIKVVDAIQARLFYMVLDSIYVPNVRNVQGVIEKKMCSVGMTKLLSESQFMLADPYFALWGKVLSSEMSLLEPDEEEVAAPIVDGGSSMLEQEEALEHAASDYSAAFSKLLCAPRPDVDPFKDIQDPKQYLAIALNRVSQVVRGKLPAVIQPSLPPKHQNALMQYFVAYKIPEPYIY